MWGPFAAKGRPKGEPKQSSMTRKVQAPPYWRRASGGDGDGDASTPRSSVRKSPRGSPCGSPRTSPGGSPRRRSPHRSPRTSPRASPKTSPTHAAAARAAATAAPEKTQGSPYGKDAVEIEVQIVPGKARTSDGYLLATVPEEK